MRTSDEGGFEKLTSATACQTYLETQEPAKIAHRLRHDQKLCSAGRLPSVLALYLPPSTSRLADAISEHLLQSRPELAVPLSVRLLQYNGIIEGIKAHMSQMRHRTQNSDEANASNHSRVIPSTEEFQVAMKVLDYLTSSHSVAHLTEESSMKEVTIAVQTHIALDPNLRIAYKEIAKPKTTGRAWKNKKCYICNYQLMESHNLYPSLCKPCGNFNLAESNLSLPPNLTLEGKTAVVTGGRLNLGFHTALRLLRCGAKVIISTRYPRDAEIRYQAQTDSRDWQDRLKIVGADFRAAKDVFRLVAIIKQVLRSWCDEEDPVKKERLDILINNAAQTLTDSIALERKVTNEEKRLKGSARSINFLVDNDNGYEARVRGGANHGSTYGLEPNEKSAIQATPGNDIADPLVSGNSSCTSSSSTVGILGEQSVKSSWVQSLSEIPYEDVITAHSVNTFVPLILCRELLPLMGAPPPAPSISRLAGPATPRGYIINVSSREGIFEDVPNATAKNGHHVHTNMSKAALNMITETEAARAWKTRKVAINTVDPGYMSSAPEFHFLGDCPIGWEDGAGRVLWPIAVGEREGTAVWGRFLKHFGESEVDVGLGR